jgi:hypothetical protein
MTIEFQNTVDTLTLNSIIRFLQSKHIQFVVKNANVIELGDWTDVSDVQFTEFAMSQIADDWECPEEWA